MNINKLLLIVLQIFFMALFAQSSAVAEEEKDKCTKPKFTKFNPPNHSEVAPGSKISFHVKHADKTKIKVFAKKIPVKISIEDRSLFLIITGTLPDTLKGTYARISLKATAEQGCKSKDGWLLKISDSPAAEVETTEAVAEPSE